MSAGGQFLCNIPSSKGTGKVLVPCGSILCHLLSRHAAALGVESPRQSHDTL